MRQKKEKRYAGKILTVLFLIIILLFIVVAIFTRRYPLRYMDVIGECAEEYSLEPELICAVIHAESRFNKDAVSSVGASGLMQIMEDTAYWLAPQINIKDFDYNQVFEPEINIRLGCYYLSMLEKRYGDITAALCAYNAGGGNVDKWLSNPDYSKDGKTLELIPFPETSNYIKHVSDNRKIYSYILFFIEI